MTGRGGKVYLHLLDVSEIRGHLKICNIETKAKNCCLLSTGEELPFRQTYELARDEYRFIVDYPTEGLDDLDTVIAVEFEEAPVPHSLYMTFDHGKSAKM